MANVVINAAPRDEIIKNGKIKATQVKIYAPPVYAADVAAFGRPAARSAKKDDAAIDNDAATDAIIADMIMEYRSAKANAKPAISPVSDTSASCMPRTIAPVYFNFCGFIRLNYNHATVIIPQEKILYDVGKFGVFIFYDKKSYFILAFKGFLTQNAPAFLVKGDI